MTNELNVFELYWSDMELLRNNDKQPFLWTLETALKTYDSFKKNSLLKHICFHYYTYSLFLLF